MGIFIIQWACTQVSTCLVYSSRKCTQTFCLCLDWCIIQCGCTQAVYIFIHVYVCLHIYSCILYSHNYSEQHASPTYTCMERLSIGCFRSVYMYLYVYIYLCVCAWLCVCVHVCVHVYDFCIFRCVSVRLSHGVVYASPSMCCLTCAWNV